MNSVSLISRYTAGVPVVVYDHVDPREDRNQPSLLPSWLPAVLTQNADLQEYAARARNVHRHMNYQARGAASGVHGLFHQFRIDAFTLFAVPATGPHGFHAIGRVLESSLRTCNNLLERLHASFFFYLLVAPSTFMKIGSYLPSAVLVGTAMLFTGLGEWVNAGWTYSPADLLAAADDKGEKAASQDAEKKWRRRHRPVLQPVVIMALTHLLGALLFVLISSSWYAAHPSITAPLLVALFATIPLAAQALPPAPPTHASVPAVLKAFNLCFASALVSITSVLNFSLAAALAVALGLPLSLSSSSASPKSSLSGRLAKYAGYGALGLGWLVLYPREVREAVWRWEVLGVWFAPFVCVVYVPLVLQAGLVCFLPR